MRVVRLVVAYDGTAFHGWQVQPGARTVQGVLEEGLSELLGSAIRVNGAGRTDAGVHARGQVASFACEGRLPARALPPRLACLLPADVRVLAAADAPPGFHARHSAVARRYSYALLDADDLLWSRFAWRPPRPAPAAALERAARGNAAQRRLPRIDGAERAPSGQAKCRQCKQKIEKGAWRIKLVFFEEGRFAPSGSIHLDCRTDYFERHDVLAPLLHFSPDLTDDERAELSRACGVDPGRA